MCRFISAEPLRRIYARQNSTFWHLSVSRTKAKAHGFLEPIVLGSPGELACLILWPLHAMGNGMELGMQLSLSRLSKIPKGRSDMKN
jgi:hypothetical protein